MVLFVRAFVCKRLALFVEESLDSPVIQASRAWTRWGMVVTPGGMELTAAEFVSQKSEPVLD